KRVIVDTDMTSSDDLQIAMYDLNRAFNANIFIPAHNGGEYADVFVQQENSDVRSDMNDKPTNGDFYEADAKSYAVLTKDQRIIFNPTINDSTTSNQKALKRKLLAGIGFDEFDAKKSVTETVNEDDLSDFLAKDHKSDRKSTRLNSSHVSISYAVFCLKKKK